MLAVREEFQESCTFYGEDVNSVEKLERTKTENAIYFLPYYLKKESIG